MGNLTVDIFWPRRMAPDIAETRYSFGFCRRTTRDLCSELGEGCSWYEYDPDAPAGEIAQKGTGDVLIVVGDPEVVIAPAAVRMLSETVRRTGAVVGPVFNETARGGQRAAMAEAYLNVSTYIEVVESFAERADTDPFGVQELDPGCFALPRQVLQEVLSGSRKQGGVLPLVSGRGMFVEPRALVHCFGQYYDAPRDDLIRLIPESVKRILDVGCAKGGYARRLKELRPDVHVTGVELNPIMAAQARECCDEVITSPVEKAQFAHRFDLVNCGDVLEHLENPWEFLQSLSRVLRPGGYLILSVPNVGHWTVVRDLMRGEFSYLPLGITCIGHIRWFTESSIRQAVADAGFDIDAFTRETIPPTRQGELFIRALRELEHTDEQSLRTNEFVIRAVKV